MAVTKYKQPTPSGLSKEAVNSLAANMAHQLNYRPGGELEPIVEKLGGRIRLQTL